MSKFDVKFVEIAGRWAFQYTPCTRFRVLRSHRIDHDEFWSRHRFTDFDAAATALRAWEATG